MRRDGLKVFFLPDVRVVHHVGGARRARAPSATAWAAGQGRWRGALLPERAGVRALRALGLDRAPREHRERLAHHYAYWREKWGFDMLNPDMDAVQRALGRHRGLLAHDARAARGGRADRGGVRDGSRDGHGRSLSVSVDARPLDIENLRAQGIGRYAHGLLGPLVEVAAERGAAAHAAARARARAGALRPGGRAPERCCGGRRCPPGRWSWPSRRCSRSTWRAPAPGCTTRCRSTAPRSSAGPASVVTMHDVVPLQWPERYLRTGLAHRAALPRGAPRGRGDLPVRARPPATRRDHLELDPARVTVIPEAAGEQFRPTDPAAVRERLGLDGPYLLYVGGLCRPAQGRGGADRRVRATGAAPRAAPRRWCWPVPGPREGSSARAGRPAWCSPGSCPTPSCRRSTRAPRCLVTASRYEGFGLPALEALACGTPVAAYDAGAIAETAGPGALLAPVGDGAALMSAAGRICDEPGAGARGCRRRAAGTQPATRGGGRRSRPGPCTKGWRPDEGRHPDHLHRRGRAAAPFAARRAGPGRRGGGGARQRLRRRHRRGGRPSMGVRCVRLDERHSFSPRDEPGACGRWTATPCCSCSPTASSRPGFVAAAAPPPRRSGRGLGGPEADPHRGARAREQRLDAIDTAGMSLDRRRKNGLVGHGRPALAFDTPGEAFGADGAVALYRREALEDAAAGGQVFDEDLVVVREGVPADWASDADLAWRTRLMGWRCVYEPERGGPPHPPLQPVHPRRHAARGSARSSSATAT